MSAGILGSFYTHKSYLLHTSNSNTGNVPLAIQKKIPGILSVFQLILNMTNLFYPKAIHSLDLHSQSIALIAHYGIGDKLVTAFEPLWNQLDQLMVVWLPLWESWDTFEINLRITW